MITSNYKTPQTHQLKLRMKVCFLIFGVLIRSMKEAVLESALSSARVCRIKHTLLHFHICTLIFQILKKL